MQSEDLEQLPLDEAELAAEREKAELEMAERLSKFGSHLSRKAEEQAQKRAPIEQRWLEDLRQYHGKYSETEQSILKDSSGSSVFVNITRNKSNAAEARLQDMLFPTDDRNWAIKPTPVPELDDLEKQGPEVAKQAREIKRLAGERCDKMQAEIDDQLTESKYQAKARDMIHDKVVLGTGVLKGPVIVGRTKQRWDTDPTGVSTLTISEDLRPAVEHVSIWDYYPDMTGANEFTFERHRWSKRQLRDFAKLPGVLQQQVQVVAGLGKGQTSIHDRMNDVRSITGLDSISQSNYYEVWEYHGPIKKREYIDAMTSANEPLDEIEIDELGDEIEAVVFFSGHHVLKVVVNPMDTEERPYSVSCWEKDDASPFGFGIPYLLRDSQKILNTAWRMMLDNAGQAVTDQIIVNQEIVEPVDGKWTLGPKKVWKLTDPARNVQEAFAVFETRSHQGEYANIAQMARQFVSEESAMPDIAQGEQGAATSTAAGMNLLMNSANIVLRRAVKNWDDDITETLIPRFYDWNMQYSKKPEIKGDFKINARGSSALLEKEQLADKLMMFANLTSQNEELSMRRDWVGFDQELCKALGIQYEPVTLSDDDIAKKQQELANQPPPPDPMAQVKQAEMQLKQQELQLKAQESQQKAQREEYKLQLDAQMQQAKLQQDYELRMADIAARENITVAQLQAKLQMDEKKNQTARDTAAAKINNETAKINLQAKNIENGWDTY